MKHSRLAILSLVPSEVKLEILGIEPKTTICKIAVLPTKLYPLYFTLSIGLEEKFNPLPNQYSKKFYYPRDDLNVHDYSSTKLKLALSTYSSTRIKAKVT